MKYLITGGSSGLGKEIANQLVDDLSAKVTTLGREGCDINIDLSTGDSSDITFYLGGLIFDVVIHCAGANFIAKYNDLYHTTAIEALLQVNAISQYRINQRLLNSGKPPLQIVHIISDAAWTPMTHSLAYNMSKAAQLMMMRQMAHEEKRSIIYGISPGKIAGTGMSKYIDTTFPPMRGLTYEEGRKYQLGRLRTGEIPVNKMAGFVLGMVEHANEYFHGHNFTIGG